MEVKFEMIVRNASFYHHNDAYYSEFCKRSSDNKKGW